MFRFYGWQTNRKKCWLVTSLRLSAPIHLWFRSMTCDLFHISLMFAHQQLPTRELVGLRILCQWRQWRQQSINFLICFFVVSIAKGYKAQDIFHWLNESERMVMSYLSSILTTTTTNNPRTKSSWLWNFKYLRDPSYHEGSGSKD